MNQKNKGMVNNLTYPEAVLYSCVRIFLAYFCSVREKQKRKLYSDSARNCFSFSNKQQHVSFNHTNWFFESSVTGGNIGLQYCGIRHFLKDIFEIWFIISPDLWKHISSVSSFQGHCANKLKQPHSR